MKFRFANYYFDDEIRHLVRPDGSTCQLRPLVNDLLTAFVRQPGGELITKQKLISDVWGETTTATDHDLQGLKRELERALDNRGIIKPIRGKGYMLAVPVLTSAKASTGVFPPGLPGAGSETSGPLHIFPGAGSPAGALFVHSFVGYGKNDYVKHIRKIVKWERRPRHMVMLSNTRPSVFMIPFRHVVKPGLEKQSWWSVVIPTNVDLVSGRWQSVDFSQYSALTFKARASSKATKRTPILMRVRLEDDSNESRSSSRRQSSSWYPEPLELHGTFRQFKLQLDNFRWSLDAWHENTQVVRRDGIVQIIFGQDATIPSSTGAIEVRDVILLV